MAWRRVTPSSGEEKRSLVRLSSSQLHSLEARVRLVTPRSSESHFAAQASRWSSVSSRLSDQGAIPNPQKAKVSVGTLFSVREAIRSMRASSWSSDGQASSRGEEAGLLLTLQPWSPGGRDLGESHPGLGGRPERSPGHSGSATAPDGCSVGAPRGQCGPFALGAPSCLLLP